MKHKNPAFMYYPKDWRADRVFGCSISARGLWHEMMGLMHESPRYGYLCDQKGEPIPSGQVARMCGVEAAEYELLLAELLAAGVPRVSLGNILYSKRMVEDEKKRKEWRKRQSSHRSTARDVTQVVTPMSPLSSFPSLSSSSYVKKEEPKNICSPAKKPDEPEGFSRFWEVYPKGRKVAKPAALRAWKAVRPALIELHAGLERWKQSQQWAELQYIPYPATFLNQRRWEDEVPTGGGNGASNGKQRVADETDQKALRQLREDAERRRNRSLQ